LWTLSHRSQPTTGPTPLVTVTARSSHTDMAPPSDEAPFPRARARQHPCGAQLARARTVTRGDLECPPRTWLFGRLWLCLWPVTTRRMETVRARLCILPRRVAYTGATCLLMRNHTQAASCPRYPDGHTCSWWESDGMRLKECGDPICQAVDTRVVC